MNCMDIRTLAPLWHSGELSGEEQASFATHLASCASCEREIRQQAALDGRLKAAFAGNAPDTARIEESVRRHLATGHRRRRWLMAGAAAAAAIVGLLFVPNSPRIYADAARDHQKEVVEKQPRHWRTGAGEIGGLTVRVGLSYAQAAALAPAGFQLERARFCALGGQAVLHLVFGDGTRDYSLYLLPHTGRNAGEHLVHVNSVEVAGFETGHFTALVAGAGTSVPCEEFARWTASHL
jgi:anti-sigma factor RsiW